MAIRIAVMSGYLVILLAIGLMAKRRSRGSLSDYLLASRTLPGWVLFLTMAATNFSAFTVFGFSGAGWRMGYAFYPIMAFGTGFMALTFLLIGRPAWHLGKAHDLLTPPELVFRLTGSRSLRLVFFLVMAVFTIPYLAMQPMAAGYALQTLLGIPYFAGAALVTAVMLLYTFLGGFRGVAWTDVFQGGMLITLLLVALAAVAKPFGGLTAANMAVADALPEMFARPGLGGAFTPGIWFGYMALWFLCDPMFPQLFQRFYSAKSPRALSTTMTLYPLLTGVLFLLPVTLGVLGRLAFPTLPEGAASDQILPLLLHDYAPPVIEALVLTAALAALMSTLDSQLLTLSSMFVRDLWTPFRERLPLGSATSERQTNHGAGQPPERRLADSPVVAKGFVVALALIGLAIAWRPPGTFLEIASETFTGLAVLFPTVIAALYWKRMNAKAAIASILADEGLVVAYHFDLLPRFGTLPVVPVVAATSVVLILGSLLARPAVSARPVFPTTGLDRNARIAWTLVFAALFAGSHDLWAWGDARLLILGFPGWVWFSLALCLISSGLFAGLSRQIEHQQR